MSDSTYETAKRCPKCKIPGRLASTIPGPVGKTQPGTKVETIMCENPDCTWFKTTWIVQINPDGSIPVRPEGEKEGSWKNPAIASTELEQRILEQTRRQVEAELSGNAEISNPRAPRPTGLDRPRGRG